MRIGLHEQVRAQSVRALNRLLAHTMALRDAYKKAHWQTSGATFALPGDVADESSIARAPRGRASRRRRQQ